jgi:hypothetical protein
VSRGLVGAGAGVLGAALAAAAVWRLRARPDAGA